MWVDLMRDNLNNCRVGKPGAVYGPSWALGIRQGLQGLIQTERYLAVVWMIRGNVK